MPSTLQVCSRILAADKHHFPVRYAHGRKMIEEAACSRSSHHTCRCCGFHMKGLWPLHATPKYNADFIDNPSRSHHAPVLFLLYGFFPFHIIIFLHLFSFQCAIYVLYYIIVKIRDLRSPVPGPPQGDGAFLYELRRFPRRNHHARNL